MKTHKNLPAPISASELRRLSVRGSVDPRTIIKVAAGENARGLAGERARAVLVAAGYPLPARGTAA